MKEYPDNLIGKDVEDLSSFDFECRTKYTKAKGWLPFEVYDMLQCGYPLPNHGEMCIRCDGGTNEKGELLPPNGMWCKVKDVVKFLKKYKKKNKFSDMEYEIFDKIMNL